MADNKNQHFVPQFYLRLFSSNKKCLNVFNLKRQRAILNASLKQQCSRDYFYGADLQNEKALSYIETDAAQAIRKLVEGKAMPGNENADFSIILLHVVLQHYRTGKKVDSLEDMADGLARKFAAPKFPDMDLEKFTFKLKGLGAFAVNNAMSHYVLLFDMKWLLVPATECQEFITSDNPVVFLNPFMPANDATGNVGIATKGLLIVFPITPSLALILYDSEVYRTHGVADGNILADCALPSDIALMNDIQGASADENLYFHSDSLDVAEIARRTKSLRPGARNKQLTVVREDTAEVRRELILTSQAHASVKPDFSFLKERKQATRWRDDFLRQRSMPLVVVRNPGMLALLKEYERLGDQGESLPVFHEFVKRHSGLNA